MWNGGKLCAKLRAQLSAVAGASCLWQLSAWDEFESQEGEEGVCNIFARVVLFGAPFAGGYYVALFS